MTTTEPRTRLFRTGTVGCIIVSAAGHSGGHSRPDNVLAPYARSLVTDDLMVEIEPGHFLLTDDGWSAFYAYTGERPDRWGPHIRDGFDTRVEWATCPRCGGMGSHWVLKPGRVEADSIHDMSPTRCDHCDGRGKTPARKVESLW